MALQHDTDGFLIGDSTQLNEQVELLESIRDDIKAIRAALNGISANAVEALLRHATQVSETSQNAATHNAPNNTIINHYAGAVSTVTQSHKTENKTGDAYVNENNTHTNTAIEQSRTVRERKQIATSTRLRDSRGRFIAGNQAGSQIATDERVARLKADNPDTLPARSAANGRGVINNRVENKSSKLSESVSAPHTELSTTRINSSNRTGDHHTAVLTQALERMGHVVENFGESQNQHTRTSTSLQANQTNQHATLNVGEQSSVQHSDSSIDSNQNTQNSNTRNQSEQNSTARTNAPTPPAPSTVINQNDSTNNQDTAPPTQPRDQRGRFNAKQNRQEPVAGVRQRDSNGRFISADTPGGEAGFISRLSGGIGKQFKKANNGDVAIDEKIDPIISVGKELKDLADPLLSVGKFAMKATVGGIKTVAGVVKKHRNDSKDQTNDTAPPVVDSTVINQSNSDTVTPTPRKRQQRTRQRRAYDTNLATVEVNRDSSRNDTQVNHAGDVVSQAHDVNNRVDSLQATLSDDTITNSSSALSNNTLNAVNTNSAPVTVVSVDSPNITRTATLNNRLNNTHDTVATQNQESNNQSTHALNSFNSDPTSDGAQQTIDDSAYTEHTAGDNHTHQNHTIADNVSHVDALNAQSIEQHAVNALNHLSANTQSPTETTINTPSFVLESANPTPTIDSLNVELPTITIGQGAIQLNSLNDSTSETQNTAKNISIHAPNTQEETVHIADNAPPVNATHSTNNSTITSSDTQNIEQSKQIEHQTPSSLKRLRDERGRFVSQRITREPVAEPTRNQINDKPVSSQAEPQAEHAKTSERGFAPAQRSSEARESKKFFREFSSYRKEQSVFDKAAKKLLRDISERESNSSEASNSGFMAGLIGGLMPMLLSVFTSLGAGIIAVFSGLGGLLLSGITGALGVIFSPIGLAIAAAGALAWGLFTEDGQKFFASIGEYISKGWDATTGFITENFSGVIETAKQFWSYLSDSFSPITKVAGDLFDGLTKTWKDITDTISVIFDTFSTFLKDKFGIDIPAIAEKVFQPVADAAEAVVSEAKDAGNKIADGAKNAYEGAKDLAGKAVEGAKELGAKAVETTKAVVNPAYESVKKSVKDGTVLKDAATGAKDTAGTVGDFATKKYNQLKFNEVDAALAFQGGSQITGLSDIQTRALAANTAKTESGGKVNSDNKQGYFGQYQFGAEALVESGLVNQEKLAAAKKSSGGNWYKKRSSDGTMGGHEAFLRDKSNWKTEGGLDEFLQNKELQDKAFVSYTNKNIAGGLRSGAISKDDEAGKIAGYAKAAHLKGVGGANKLYKSGIASTDGNGTSTATSAKQAFNAMNETVAAISAKIAKGEKPAENQTASAKPIEILEKLSPISTASANETPYQAPKTTVTGQQNKSLLSQQEPAKHIVFNVASSDSVTTSNHAPVTTNTAQNQANQQQSLANKTASSNNQITNANLALESYAKTGIFNQTVNSNQSTAAQSDLTNQFVSDIANGKLEQDGKVKYVSDNSSLDAKLNELKQNEAKVINTKHNTDSNLTAIAPAVSPKSDIAATLVKQTSSDSFSRLLNTASPINIATAMSALPKIPAIPTIADAPSVSMPANLPIKPPISVNFPTAEVGQNLSDNRLAHIVSGGYSRLQN